LVERERPVVGVLAIQGAVDKHYVALERVGAAGRPVLRKDDLDGLTALILPGGESTTIAMGLERLGLYEPIQAFAGRGRAVLGTCAGAILLARRCENHPVRTLDLLDVRVDRNAYGTQVDSFTAVSDPGGPAEFDGMRCVFIRAPQIRDPGPAIEVLLRVDGLPVLIRRGRVMAATFHPELGDDLRIHHALIA
jgi:5'-phosphate synthase pdxT subunit